MSRYTAIGIAAHAFIHSTAMLPFIFAGSKFLRSRQELPALEHIPPQIVALDGEPEFIELDEQEFALNRRNKSSCQKMLSGLLSRFSGLFTFPAQPVFENNDDSVLLVPR